MRGDLPNIRHMRVFLEAAKSGSISIAAARCNLSQPAATQAIARLEADLGTVLLIRKRQKSALTTCGSVFAHRATQALRHMRQGAQSALRAAGEKAWRKPNFELSVTASQLRNPLCCPPLGR